MKFDFTVFLIFMLALTYDVSAHAVQCKYILNCTNIFSMELKSLKFWCKTLSQVSLDQNCSKEISRNLL